VMFRRLLLSMTMLLVASGTGLALVRPPLIRPEIPVQTTKPHILPMHRHMAECDRTAAEPVQIICILDRSGSMRALAEDTIGGYNSFLEKQKNSTSSWEEIIRQA